MHPTPSALSVLALASILASCTSSPAVEIVEAFRAAREAGRLEEARSYLGPDPRIWYDRREGEGAPWRLGGGRFAAWDEHFQGVTERATPWVVEADRVWADMAETNDYYRLLERPEPGIWRATYFLDGQGRIAGFMVSGVPGREPSPSRRKEFEAWAREQDPVESEYLMPGGSLDPTGDRAPRMRALILRWREAVGLGPLD